MTFDCHHYHAPTPLSPDDHHIVPQAWWEHLGTTWIEHHPIVRETVHVPPSCHRNAHVHIDQLVASSGKVIPGHHDIMYAVALLGYQRALSLGLTPARTL